MELVTFIADSAADAAMQVRRRLGTTAVVVHVRPLPAKPRRWFGRPRPRFEVVAYRPEPGSGGLDATSDAPARPDFGPAPTPAAEVNHDGAGQGDVPTADPPVPARAGGGAWRVGALLESAGLLPANAQRVVDQLRRAHGEAPPEALSAELQLVRGELTKLWRGPTPRIADGAPLHLLVGAPGVGKTTCLCKWLTQLVLQEGRPARVWRLDGAIANTAESLNVYCEVLGVPLERSWPADGGAERQADAEAVRFVDLPGADWRHPAAIRELAGELRRFPRAQVHLVLNGAYDTSLLLRQVRAFAGLPVNDLIVTHLDEESRWGKIWNLVLGTNYSVRFLSAGQNVPGEFFAATAEAVLQRQFPA